MREKRSAKLVRRNGEIGCVQHKAAISNMAIDTSTENKITNND